MPRRPPRSYDEDEESDDDSHSDPASYEGEAEGSESYSESQTGTYTSRQEESTTGRSRSSRYTTEEEGTRYTTEEGEESESESGSEEEDSDEEESDDDDEDDEDDEDYDDEYTSSEEESVPDEVGHEEDEEDPSEITGLTYESNATSLVWGQTPEQEVAADPLGAQSRHSQDDNSLEELFPNAPMGGATQDHRKAPKLSSGFESDDQSQQSKDSHGFVKSKDSHRAGGGSGFMPTLTEEQDARSGDDNAPLWSSHADPFASAAPPNTEEYRMRQRMRNNPNGNFQDDEESAYTTNDERSEYTKTDGESTHAGASLFGGGTQKYHADYGDGQVDRASSSDVASDRGSDAFRDETDRTDEDGRVQAQDDDEDASSRHSKKSRKSFFSRSSRSKKKGKDNDDDGSRRSKRSFRRKSKRRGKQGDDDDASAQSKNVTALAGERDMRDAFGTGGLGDVEDPPDRYKSNSNIPWDQEDNFADEHKAERSKLNKKESDGLRERRARGDWSTRCLVMGLVCVCCLLLGAVFGVLYFTGIVLGDDDDDDDDNNGDATTEPLANALDLRAAVDNYLQNGSVGTDTANRYGHPIGTWDVSGVDSFYGLFDAVGRNAAAATFNEDITGWNTTSVRDMSFMFNGAKAFNQNIGSTWDVSNVNAMTGMFQMAETFNQDLSSWQTGAVTDMKWMFHGAKSFNSNLKTWDVSKVTNLQAMFQQAHAFNGDISSWNVGAVTDMGWLFYNATSFNVDLRQWQVDQVTMMRSTFNRATLFDHDISSWNVARLQDANFMFTGAESFRQDLCEWGPKLSPSNATVVAMFRETRCLNTDRPHLLGSPPGPFCVDCFAQPS